jgi:membrane protein DedA with SNARE-associated domain/rhodanese-related sulfurtransferase
MHTLSELLAAYGLAFVFVHVFADQAGVPLPSYPTLIVASALSGGGTRRSIELAAVAVLAALAADLGWYLAGRRWGRPVLRRICRLALVPDSCARRTESTYRRWGAGSLLFAKFVPGFSALAATLSGAISMRAAKFIALDAIGALVWASLAIAMGSSLRAEVNGVLAILVQRGREGLWAVVGAFALFVLYRGWRRRQFMRELRMARVTAADLRAMLDRGETPIILDARSPLGPGHEPRIPGSIAVERGEGGFAIPLSSVDREVVIYCDCPNEASAARLAKQLLARGVRRVRPLAGGIDAWVAAGYEVVS